MKQYLVILLSIFSINAYASQAFFTGRQSMVKTWDNNVSRSCEYKFMNRTFEVMFDKFDKCPQTINPNQYLKK